MEHNDALAIVETEEQAKKLADTLTKWFGGLWRYQKEEHGFCLYVSNLPADKHEKACYFLYGWFAAIR